MNILKRSIVPVYWIQVYPLIGNLIPRAPWGQGCLIGRPSACDVNEENAIGPICYRITWTLKLL